MFLVPILAFCSRLFSYHGRNIEANNHTVIRFDDIPTANGLANLPSLYHHLSFSSYSVLSPRDPALDGMISKHDRNCAVSSSNSLIGSRPSENAHGAYFEIANTALMAEQGLQPYFTLHSFFIKPLDAPAPGTVIYVKGFTKAQEPPRVWHVDFLRGFDLPFLVKMEEYSGEEWNETYKVEITADFGYDALDWEFCIDDLQLQFFVLPKHEHEEHTGSQVVLKGK